ncbi:MAG TPA: flagellar basal body rod protein FlgB [Treponemataceae bacterium]|nr:flagellar basal body rod protein FlgB [Treponemataceae bacterium]
MNSFSRSVDILHRGLDVSSLRYQVSANNLANAEVPNFKRTSVNFEAELKKALDSEKNAAKTMKLATTDSKHFQLEQPIDYKSVQPRRVVDYTTTSKANGNNVDAEQEAMNILQTQLQYQLLTQMQSFEFAQMKIALK